MQRGLSVSIFSAIRNDKFQATEACPSEQSILRAPVGGIGPGSDPFGSLMVTRYAAVDRILRSSAFRTPRGYRNANDPAGAPRFDPAGPLSLHRRHWLLFQSGDAHARSRSRPPTRRPPVPMAWQR
jgi:hypothetical protein